MRCELGFADHLHHRVRSSEAYGPLRKNLGIALHRSATLFFATHVRHDGQANSTALHRRDRLGSGGFWRCRSRLAPPFGAQW